MKNADTVLTGGDETGVPRRNRGAKWRGVLTDYLGLGLALIGLIAVFSLSSNHFFSPPTFRTIANQIPDAVIVAVGMTFVIIIGGIDLSVGSVLALSSAALGLSLVNLNLPLPVAIVCCLCAGLICGAINGLVTIRWSLPSFIVTLGMLEAARGGAYLATSSQTLYIGGAVEKIAEISFFGLSLPFLVAILIVVAGQITLSRTVFGRYMLAVGANEEVVRFSGINPRPIKLAVFALCGLLAGVAAVFQSARLSSVNPNAGIGFELQAIAAVVIGGTSLMGGRGSVINTFFGVLIIAVLGTGLAQVGAQEPTKRLVTGLVIVAAVIIDHYRRRLETSKGKST
ncbi:MAG TPA: ABC transporter permease [Blastocatellia bacterium]|jgi:ribose transport system permease protein|nr:ABC transporter permease [Blastocatellia bacterium]